MEATSPRSRSLRRASKVAFTTLCGLVLPSDFVRMLDGRTLQASSAVQRAWLRAARASRAPVQFVTPFGESKKGYISTLMFTNLQRRPEEKRSNWSAVLNIVEVG